MTSFSFIRRRTFAQGSVYVHLAQSQQPIPLWPQNLLHMLATFQDDRDLFGLIDFQLSQPSMPGT